MITLLPFYRKVPDYDKEPIWVKNLRSVNYFQMIRYLYDTLVRVSLDREKFPMKDIKFLINTDKKTGFESRFDPDRLFQSDLRNLPLIESKIVAETNAVIAIKGKLVLCGCDHLVKRDIHRLFEIDKDFDIAIPIRKQKKVNNAIVIVNDRKPDLVRKFFIKRKELYYKLSSDVNTRKNWAWYGDQIVYDYYLDEFRGKDRRYPKHIKVKKDGLTFLLFEYGSEYISTSDGYLYNANSVIIDFKGTDRKRFLAKAYTRLIGDFISNVEAI